MNSKAIQGPLLLPFTEIGIGDRLLVGGKGASLGEMTRAGLPTPQGFVITTMAFNAWLQSLDQHYAIRRRIAALKPGDLDAVKLCTRDIRECIEQAPLHDDLLEAIASAYTQIGEDEPVAVRSSATSEDSEEASFAGLQDTYLWVKGLNSLLDRLLACWASLYNPESVSYRLRLGLPEDQLAMGVVVQRMVYSRCSGVMFTRSPTTGDRSVITIEGSWGLGSSIVSGEVTPDRFVVNKVTGEFRTRNIADKAIEHVPVDSGGIREQAVSDTLRRQCCLSEEQLRALVALGKQVERHYGAPQDIEWALDQEGSIHLLQSRPETVWANRERAPLAVPAASPFDHIFSALGGQKK